MKIKSLYIILLTGILFGCKVSLHAPAEPVGFNIEPNSKSIVIVDGGVTNTTGLVIKKKREGVVKEVKNQYLVMLSSALQKQLCLNIITDTTLNDEQKNKVLKKDSVEVAGIAGKYNTSIILILKDCYAGFKAGDVKKVSGSDGKTTTKIAAYDVFFDTEWLILQAKIINEKTVTASGFHSHREIPGKLIARGPGFSANKKDILDMAEKNALNVALLFKY